MKARLLLVAALLTSACVVTTHEGPGQPPRVAPTPPPPSIPTTEPNEADLQEVPTAPEGPAE